MLRRRFSAGVSSAAALNAFGVSTAAGALVTQRRAQVSISGDDAEPAALQPRAAQSLPRTVTATGRGGEVITIVDNTDEVVAANRAFIEAHRRAKEADEELQMPIHPEALQPAFIKVNRSAKLVRFKPNVTMDTLVRLDHHVPLPPAPEHPWIPEQPIGDFADIVHGDGMIGVVGTGEIGFDNDAREYPRHWRGLRPRFLPGLRLPDAMGPVSPDVVVKYSLDKTGRGLFATRDIKKGDLIMCVKSSAVSLGYVARLDRLVEMMRDLLLRVHDAVKAEEEEWARGTAVPGGEKMVRAHAEMERLHTWILQGQMSSLVEQWPGEYTEKLIRKLGGRQVLDDLELHPLHIARLAAIIDMNSFIVEGFYNDDRGRGYWPEAGLLNHSCCPNADYDIMTEENFKISDMNPAFVAARERYEEAMRAEAEKAASAAAAAAAAATDAATATAAATEATQGSAPAAGEEVERAPEGKRTASSSSSAQSDVDAADGAGEGNLLRKMEMRKQSAPPPAERKQVAVLYEDDEEDRGSSAASRAATEYYDPSSTYLFVCRANRDIAAGEEVLISYVPPEWRYDNRQHVLYERYRFWCRCEKCVPDVESFLKMYPRASMFIVLVFVFLNIVVYTVREHGIKAQENADKGMLFPQGGLWGVRDEDLPENFRRHEDVLVEKHPPQYPIPEERKQ